MWLPVYLIGDFGWPGWVVFALPNVIGAMAVGVLITDAAEAGRVAERHRTMIAAFSVWTILFHALFAGRMVRVFNDATLPAVVSDYWPAQLTGLALALLVALFAILPLGRAAKAAIVVWLVSVGLGVAAFVTGPAFTVGPLEGRFGLGALAMAAPVLGFGFLLCPFMDGTLLGVRAALRGSRGTLAFVLGFGVLFLVMIVMTLGYAGRLNEEGFGAFSVYIFPCHVIVQTAFTVGVHVRWLASRGVVGTGGRGLVWTILLGVGVFIVFAGSIAARAEGEPVVLDGYGLWRLLYDLFLGAYALVFPAYALIVMFGRRRLRLTERGVWVGWAVAVALGLPCLVMGAVIQEQAWLLGVIASAVLGLVAARMMGRTAPAWLVGPAG